MGLFSRKNENPKWDASTLADCLANELDFEIEVGDEYVIVRDAGELYALVELIEDGEECLVSFNLDLMPGTAAEIAVELERILPTHIELDNAFVAQQITRNDGELN